MSADADVGPAPAQPDFAGRGPGLVTTEHIDRIKAELAFCLLYCGDDTLLPKAERLLQEVVAARPDWVPPLLRLGQLRLRLNDLDEAQAKLEYALDKVAEPQTDEQTAMLVLIRTYLGIVYWRLSERPGLPKSEIIRLLCMSALQSEAVFAMNTEIRHRRAAAANSAYCRAELLRRDPDRQAEHERVGKTMLDFLRGGPHYGAWSDEKLWSTMRLDSVLRAEKAFGDRAAAARVASELAARITAKIDRLEVSGLARSAAFDQLSFDERDIYLTALGVRDQPPGRPDAAAHATG
jgi:hypothetical protein